MNGSDSTATPAPPPLPPQMPPLPLASPPWWVHPPRRRGVLRSILVGLCVIIFILSIILNIVLMAAIPGRIETGLAKSTIRDGVDDQIVAVYQVQDVIDDEAARRFEEFHREIIRDHRVKAVLLRIDSPGGGVAASDQIHNLVVDLKKRGKKVVVSMGAMATSGAYYVAAPADCIVAEETTITGSIGVIMGWMVLRGTLEKIGVESVIIKSRNAEGWKDEISPFRQPDPRQRAHLQALLDDMQKRFEHVVREGRGEKLMTRVERYTVKVGEGETVREEQRTDLEPFNGKVYLSDEARELGLVDEIGYLERAIDLARQLAAAPRAKVVVYRAYKSFLQRMLEARSGQSLQLDARLLDRLQSPQIMLMWKAD